MENSIARKFWMLLAVCALWVLLLPGAARAGVVVSGTCGASGDNLTWTLDDAGTLTISGSGEMDNYTTVLANSNHQAP